MTLDEAKERDDYTNQIDHLKERIKELEEDLAICYEEKVTLTKSHGEHADQLIDCHKVKEILEAVIMKKDDIFEAIKGVCFNQDLDHKDALCRARRGCDEALSLTPASIRNKHECEQRVIEAAKQMPPIMQTILDLVTEGTLVAGWHLNGDTEPIETFFPELEQQETARFIEALTQLDKESNESFKKNYSDTSRP